MSDTSKDSSSTAPDSPRLPDLLETHDYAKYVLHGKKEILAILRRLQDSVSLITAFFDSGREMMLTSLIDVGEESIVIDIGSDSGVNRKVLEVDKIFCVASHEKVRIQFELGRLTRIDFAGGPAFSAALPRSVLRLQRRDFFRLTMPIARPLKCLIPRADAEGNLDFAEVSIVDISGGGLALTVPKDMPLERGMEFPECRIDLPEVGAITMTIAVRNVFEVELRSGARITRAGCAFVKPNGPMLALIQRYIMKVERERKARESGLI